MTVVAIPLLPLNGRTPCGGNGSDSEESGSQSYLESVGYRKVVFSDLPSGYSNCLVARPSDPGLPLGGEIGQRQVALSLHCEQASKTTAMFSPLKEAHDRMCYTHLNDLVICPYMCSKCTHD